jgi:hypothetical protein
MSSVDPVEKLKLLLWYGSTVSTLSTILTGTYLHTNIRSDIFLYIEH